MVQLRDGEEGWFPLKAQSELSIQPMSDTNFSNFPIFFLRSGKGLRVERQVVQFARRYQIMIRTCICPELYFLQVPFMSLS